MQSLSGNLILDGRVLVVSGPFLGKGSVLTVRACAYLCEEGEAGCRLQAAGSSCAVGERLHAPPAAAASAGGVSVSLTALPFSELPASAAGKVRTGQSRRASHAERKNTPVTRTSLQFIEVPPATLCNVILWY